MKRNWGVRQHVTFVAAACLVAIALSSCIGSSGPSTLSATTTPAFLPCPTTEPTLTPTPEPTATDTPLPTSVVPSPTADATPSSPSVPAGFAQLQAEMASATANYEEPGTYAVAVTDLQTMQTVGVNQDKELQSGCIINFFVLMRAVYDVQQGALPLDAVDGLIRQTIWASDAAAAHELDLIVGNGNAVAGVTKVAAMVHDRLLLPQVIFDHPPAYPEETLGISAENLVTAAAMNEALSSLYHGTLLTGKNRDYLLEAMTRVKPGLNYLTAALPSEATVSHKNGFYWEASGWVDNDTGIVRFERNGTTYAYAITFISVDVPDKYADIPLG